MLRLATFAILIAFLISACSSVASPVSAPSLIPSATATHTVSAADITAAATYRLTSPPSFTPTFTPSASPTATVTHTPRATATATAIPEAILCESFLVTSVYSPEPIILDDLEDFIQINLPYPWMTVVIDIYDLSTNEIIEFGTVTGGFPVVLDLSPQFYPEIGEYEWVMTLQDETRTGLCEVRGTFDTRADELPQAESTAEATAEVTAEMTPEATLRPVPFPPR